MSLVIQRVTALPDPLVANTLYLVAASATELQVVAVDTEGNTTRSSFTKAQSTADISAALTTALAGYYTSAQTDSAIAAAIAALDTSNVALYAADIDARDALVGGLTKNVFVLVEDATGDVTVDAGAALYFYNDATTTFIKVAEYESMDINLSAAIATAFPNKAQLDKIGEIGGALSYDGVVVGGVIEGVHAW